MKQLQIGYFSARSPYNRRLWSGTPYYMYKMLEKHCGSVTYLGEIPSILTKVGKLTNGILSLVSKRYNYGHSRALAWQYKKAIERQLQGKQFDILFTQAIPEAAYLDTSIPIVLTTDATLRGLFGYYSYFSNVFKWSERESLEVEGAAFRNASLLLFSSDWAANHAQEDYNFSPQKIQVVQLGASFDHIPSREDLMDVQKDGTTCRLLFVGVEWDRKGGPIVFEAFQELRRRHIDAELIICGVVPPAKYRHDKMRVIPFLDKNDPAAQQKLRELFFHSDFFFLPTRAESYGVVFAEASAFGLPIISTNTGGVPTVVVEGVNGHLLPIDADALAYAELIASLLSDRERYSSLRQSARYYFEQNLNWDTWGKRVRSHIYEVLGR